MNQTANLQTAESRAVVEDYIRRFRESLTDIPAEERDHLVSYARAQIELDLELEPAEWGTAETARSVLSRIGEPAAYARRLRETALPGKEREAQREPETVSEAAALTPCRVCRQQISLEAHLCPHCGAPFPARKLGPASGYEWKSRARLFGVPLVHIAFGRDKNGKLRVAKGVIAIGQFGIGAITFAQFGVGLIFGLGQFVAAPLALGQFALGLAAAGQFGIGLLAGAGQFASGLLGAWGQVTITPR